MTALSGFTSTMLPCYQTYPNGVTPANADTLLALSTHSIRPSSVIDLCRIDSWLDFHRVRKALPKEGDISADFERFDISRRCWDISRRLQALNAAVSGNLEVSDQRYTHRT